MANLYDGYHGINNETAEKITSNQTGFTYEEFAWKPIHVGMQMGHGIYFFIHDLPNDDPVKFSLGYASETSNIDVDNFDKDVLNVQINYEISDILDLNTDDGQRYMEEYERYSRELNKTYGYTELPPDHFDKLVRWCIGQTRYKLFSKRFRGGARVNNGECGLVCLTNYDIIDKTSLKTIKG
ncbi:MAG: hypothetical protein FWE90_10415 [Defluviitaleaceae bacterium]|nr:hypothetical protein [Defluviitaleaceae bacterium]